MTLSAAVKITRALDKATAQLTFAPPVTHVYRPLQHAQRPAERYLERFCRPGVEAMFIGMNPGPWGMSQTGVPFGEVATVASWMGIDEPVDHPDPEHPKRPILGFDCERSEVSGRRLWGLAEAHFEDPGDFFDRFFVWNWCPLAFLEESGRNRTPDKLPIEERKALEEVCDASLRAMTEHVSPSIVIGVGAFATKRCRIALGDDVNIRTVLHPSPASPIANRGWQPQAEAQLTEMGIDLSAGSRRSNQS